MKNNSVSIVIPAYNEEAIIKSAVEVAHEILQDAKIDFEIIVVNDGSNDKTENVLRKSFSNTPQIIIQYKKSNEGFGSAVKTGIELSSKQFIFCVPADSPLTTDLFLAFMENIDKADVLVSYRKERVGYSPRMLLNSWVYHFLISNLFNIKLRDYNWIHLYNRKIFDEGKIEIEYKGIFMLAEILIKAKRAGFTFYEFEVEQKERLTGIATASKLVAILKTISEMVHFRFMN